MVFYDRAKFGNEKTQKVVYSAEGFSLQKFATATAAGNRPLAKEPCKTWRQAFRRQPRNCIREAASRSHFANENVETGQQALVDLYHQSILKRGPARRRRADDGVVATEPHRRQHSRGASRRSRRRQRKRPSRRLGFRKSSTGVMTTSSSSKSATMSRLWLQRYQTNNLVLTYNCKNNYFIEGSA